MGLEILRFSQNDKLNDTLSISAVVVLRSEAFGKISSPFFRWIISRQLLCYYVTVLVGYRVSVLGS